MQYRLQQTEQSFSSPRAMATLNSTSATKGRTPLIEAVTIPPNTTIKELLTRTAPKPWRQEAQKHYFSDLRDWYSKEDPTSQGPTALSNLVLPSPKTCLYIADVMKNAIEEGCRSIHHPYSIGKRLPVDFAQIYKLGNDLVRNRGIWEERRNWIQNASLDEKWETDDLEKLEAAVSRCPWLSGLPGIQSGMESATHSFGTLLSNRWLTSAALSCMLDVVRWEYTRAPEFDKTTHILSPYIGHSICVAPDSNYPSQIGKRIASGAIKRLLFPMNIAEAHWIAVEIDINRFLISFGDSYPTFSSPYMKKVISDITSWLNCWSQAPDTKWMVNLSGIPVGLQQDSTSCGVAAVSAIHHRTYCCENTPLWTSETTKWIRSYYFIRIVEVGMDMADDVTVSSSLKVSKLSLVSEKLSLHTTLHQDSNLTPGRTVVDGLHQESEHLMPPEESISEEDRERLYQSLRAKEEERDGMDTPTVNVDDKVEMLEEFDESKLDEVTEGSDEELTETDFLQRVNSQFGYCVLVLTNGFLPLGSKIPYLSASHSCNRPQCFVRYEYPRSCPVRTLWGLA